MITDELEHNIRVQEQTERDEALIRCYEETLQQESGKIIMYCKSVRIITLSD